MALEGLDPLPVGRAGGKHLESAGAPGVQNREGADVGVGSSTKISAWLLTEVWTNAPDRRQSLPVGVNGRLERTVDRGLFVDDPHLALAQTLRLLVETKKSSCRKSEERLEGGEDDMHDLVVLLYERQEVGAHRRTDDGGVRTVRLHRVRADIVR